MSGLDTTHVEGLAYFIYFIPEGDRNLCSWGLYASSVLENQAVLGEMKLSF